jgi:hypothetical protein
MAKDDADDDTLPDKDAAKGFYAKYEPKEVLGRYVAKYNSSKKELKRRRRGKNLRFGLDSIFTLSRLHSRFDT